MATEPTATVPVPGQEPVLITAEQIRAATIGIAPDPIFTYAVEIDGRWWPPRQVVYRAIGRSQSNDRPISHRCVEALAALGFRTFEPVTFNEKGRVVVPDDRRRQN
ncbi:MULTISPECIES: hypothetical protein [unclassified Streptomyces]|uniref:hypothetical protein n=1 Tax=unclassified Streptomyces TaxID=2593676 RepID=UPI0022B6CA30|nr:MULTISPECIES: hypothetical protein [unclassified Streptomyces]MCZ7415788.1 hypothetical protein [Streptomyces sp. WMMC897]MCZ7434401.1 hypothetical protein [Streptomyces sp. WMMC1477]